MKRFARVAWIALWIAGCATRPGRGEDPIVGGWHGTGPAEGVRLVIQGDHTYQMNTVPDDPEPNEKGTWSGSGKQYALVAEGGKRWVKVDEQGQLIVIVPEDDDTAVGDLNDDNSVSARFMRDDARTKGSTPKPPPATDKPKKVGKPPVGEWRYAYTSKSSIPAAPPLPFDVMTFKDQGKVALKLTAAGKEFEGAFKVEGDVLSISMGDGPAAKVDLSYRWEEGGERLVLKAVGSENSPFNLEWTMLKPERFLDCDFEGSWINVLKDEGVSEEYQIGKDGSFKRAIKSKDGVVVSTGDARVHDFFRLWRAPFGTALTIVFLVPDMQAQGTATLKLERDGGDLVLTPMELRENGELAPRAEAKEVWKRPK